MFRSRLKYYFAWKVAEGACVWGGFGWDDKTKEWDGVSNMNILGFELAGSIRDLSRNWNMNTQKWLQNCVYDRTGGSMLMTYGVSAFWHGFYPGYYLFFLSIVLPQSLGRLFYSKIRPLFQGNQVTSSLYHVVGIVCTSLVGNYLATSFQNLTFDRAIITWSKLQFSGHIIVVALYMLLSMIPKPRRKQKKD